MLKIILIVLAAIGIAAAIVFALLMSWVKSMSAGYTLIDKDLNDSYYHKDGQVYYVLGGNFFEIGPKLMESADLASFKVLGVLYARDNQHVFYRDNIFPQADAATFRLLTEIYACDSQQVFYLDKPIPESDPKSFNTLWGDYAEDDKNLYHGEAIVTQKKPDTVPNKIPSDETGSYLRYGEQLYVNGKPLSGISNSSRFHLKTHGYASDGDRIYYDLMPLPYVDASSFRMIDGYFARDQKNILLFGKIVSGVDPDTFSAREYNDLVGTGSFYIAPHHIVFLDLSSLSTMGEFSQYRTDGQFIYYINTRIEQAHSDSFEILDELFSKDQEHVYHGANQLTDADPASFKILQRGFSRDATHLYWQELRVQGIDPDQFVYEEDMWAKEIAPGLGKLVRNE